MQTAVATVCHFFNANLFPMLSLSIPPGILKQIERIERQCLWRGNSDTPRQSLAAWELVCRPKEKGGLGVINLRIQNEALLLKHLHKFYNKVDVPWVKLIWDSYYYNVVPHGTMLCGSFWWKDIFKLSGKYLSRTQVKVNNGSTLLFWSDKWMLDGPTTFVRDRFPMLFSYVIDDKQSIQELVNSEDFVGLFHLPLSSQAFEEF